MSYISIMHINGLSAGNMKCLFGCLQTHIKLGGTKINLDSTHAFNRIYADANFFIFCFVS